MSYLKIVEELFLGKIELTRFQEFMKDSGFQKFISKLGTEFGLIDSLTDSFKNGLVEAGTPILGLPTMKINELFAIDSDGLFITKNTTDSIPLVNDNNWYWVKISHAYNTREIGTVSISDSGILIGNNTEFLKIFRGQPDFPSKIKFHNSVNNLLEYEVLEVIDDYTATLQGVFITESNLEFSLIGTFTEGSVPSTANKYPFQYDYCLGELVLSNTTTPPAYTLGKEFFLARIKLNGGNLYIEDKRSDFRFKLQSDFYQNQLPSVQNPLIGVEEIKWDSQVSTKDKNLVYIGWGLRTTSYTFDSNTNLLTITNGKGGRFKSTTFTTNFTDGDFNGWRVYPKGGTNYFKILDSVKVIGTLKLTLMNGDALYLSGSDELIIAPPAEEIEIICSISSSTNTELPDFNFLCPINEGYAKIPLLVYESPFSYYQIKYRYKSHNNYSEIYTLINDTVGYYAENQHNIDGLLTGTIQTPYTIIGGFSFIILTMASTAYSVYNLGDIPGIMITALDGPPPVTQPYKIDLEVGASKKNQILLAAGVFTLTANLIINLKSNTTTKNGNEFNLCFIGNITLNGFAIEIRENYVDPGTPGTLLKSISSQAELTYRQWSAWDFIWINFTYISTAWFLKEENNFYRVYGNKLAIDVHTADIATINTSRVVTSLLGHSSWFSCNLGATVTVTAGQIVTKKIDAKTVFVTIDVTVTIAGGPPTVIYLDLETNLAAIFNSALLLFNTVGYCLGADFCMVQAISPYLLFAVNGTTIPNFGTGTHLGWSGIIFLT
jgi:hypothetical protein